MTLMHPILTDIKTIAGNENVLELTLFIPAALVYFEGHFPESPILPGVAQLDLALYYAERYLNVDKQRVDAISQIKFTQIIQPDTTLTLTLTLQKNQLSFVYTKEENVYSSGKVRLMQDQLCD